MQDPQLEAFYQQHRPFIDNGTVPDDPNGLNMTYFSARGTTRFVKFYTVKLEDYVELDEPTGPNFYWQSCDWNDNKYHFATDDCILFNGKSDKIPELSRNFCANLLQAYLIDD